MKKTLLFLALASLMSTGCSKTWSGIKQDTNELLVDTKEVIHEATAPSYDATAPRPNYGTTVPIGTPSYSGSTAAVNTPTYRTTAPVVQNNVSSWDQTTPPAPAANRVVTAAQTMMATPTQPTTSTVTPVSQSNHVQVFEDTPTVTVK